jgi:hypothetical protein
MPRNNRRSYSPNPRMTRGPIPRNNATDDLAGYFRAGLLYEILFSLHYLISFLLLHPEHSRSTYVILLMSFGPSLSDVEFVVKLKWTCEGLNQGPPVAS